MIYHQICPVISLILNPSCSKSRYHAHLAYILPKFPDDVSELTSLNFVPLIFG
jgi:hypothetical protein